MKNGLDHAALKAKQRATREGFPETMGLRAHRAISWIGLRETGSVKVARKIRWHMASGFVTRDADELRVVQKRSEARLQLLGKRFSRVAHATRLRGRQ